MDRLYTFALPSDQPFLRRVPSLRHFADSAGNRLGAVFLGCTATNMSQVACPRCKAKSPDGAKICQWCAKPLPDPRQPKWLLLAALLIAVISAAIAVAVVLANR